MWLNYSSIPQPSVSVNISNLYSASFALWMMIVAMFPTRHCWCKNSCLWRKRTNQISAAHNGTYWYGQ